MAAIRTHGLGSDVAARAGDPLRTVSDWIADPSNPFFAKAQANRVWFHLMGRGLVLWCPLRGFRAAGRSPLRHIRY